jgi:hypothetical protein
MEILQLKQQGKIRENLVLTEILIQSLKSTKESPLLSEQDKSRQKQLFMSGVAFRNSVEQETKITFSPSNYHDLVTIVELLEQQTPNTNYIVENFIEFLHTLSRMNAISKIKPNAKKYEAMFRYLTMELEAECTGGECSLFYDEGSDTLCKQMQMPKPKTITQIHGVK